ncbi:MAG: VWA domain-containing protein [Aquificae bacterium]|nr:VWA domain-containing protein [Aquificota bacterium]
MEVLFKYWQFLPIGIITLICVVICSIFIKSRKVIYFPHIELFGKQKRFSVKYLPFLWILLTVFITLIAMFPYKKEYFYSEKKVYNIVLCLDVSNSMKENNKLKIAKEIIRDFLLKRSKEDRIALVVFDNLPFRLSPLTSDKGYLLKIIPSIYPAMVDIGGTAMYDALIDSLNIFDINQKNKIIILLSDGGDINSSHTLEDVIAKNRVIKAKIYSIGISSGLNFRNLERLSEASNGKAFFIKDRYEKALREVFTEINSLEPSLIKEYRLEVEKPVDLWIKVLALFVFVLIFVKMWFLSIRERYV